MSEAEKSSHVIRNFPFTAQIDGSDCGAASLCMVARYLGLDSVLSETRHICGTDVTGLNLCAAAESMGLQAEFLRKSFTAVCEMSVPLITHWEGNHWLVIIGFKDGQVKIADPAAGIYWLPVSQAEKKYSGYICRITGDAGNVCLMKRENELLRCLTPFKRVLIPSAIMMLFMIAAELCLPHIIQRVVDESLLYDPVYFDWLAIFTALAAGGAFMCWLLKEWLLNSGASRSESLILDNLLKKWLHLPESFFKGRSFSELRVRLESAFEISRYLVKIAGKGLFALLEIIAVFAMLEYYKSALTFALLFLPSLALAVYSFYLTRQYTGIFKLARENFLQAVDDTTRGIFSIRTAATESYFTKLQKNSRAGMYGMTAAAKRNLVICEKGAAALGFASCLLYFMLQCSAYSKNEITLGTLTALTILSCFALNALFRIIGERANFAEGTVVYDYLNDVFDTRANVEEREKVEEAGSIEWQTTLSGREEDRFGLKVAKGESLFVCGSSSKLFLETLCEPAFEGTVLEVAGRQFTDQAEFPVFSCMESHSHLFNTTLLENVACGEAVDTQRIRWCLRLALADHLEKRLQFGLRTKIIPGLLEDSDCRKIILARCLYRKRPLHILEDISDFLDDREIEVFIYHLLKHMDEQTIILRDENVRLARGAANAVVFKGEKLVEKGNFKELLNNRGVFCKMYNNLT